MIAQAMWDSYQEILSTRSEQEHINQYLYSNIEHPYITALLGNNDENTGQYRDDGDEEGYDDGEVHDGEGDAGQEIERGEGNGNAEEST
jgi:hypothetical protein